MGAEGGRGASWSSSSQTRDIRLAKGKFRSETRRRTRMRLIASQALCFSRRKNDAAFCCCYLKCSKRHGGKPSYRDFDANFFCMLFLMANTCLIVIFVAEH